MTVASLLGSNERHIKDSSDIHRSFYNVLSDFSFKKNAGSLTPSTSNNTSGSFTRVSNYKESNELNQRPKTCGKTNHCIFVVII